MNKFLSILGGAIFSVLCFVGFFLVQSLLFNWIGSWNIWKFGPDAEIWVYGGLFGGMILFVFALIANGS